MAKIGNVELGGLPSQGHKYQSAAVFWLTAVPSSDFTYAPESSPWEAVVTSGADFVVARCVDRVSRDTALSSGFEFCQRALDFATFRQNLPLLTKDAANTHVLLFEKDGHLTLQLNDLGEMKIHIGNLTITVRDRDGNIVPQKQVPIRWVEALRYYRLSQCSGDVFEGYRNMWLALETLLHGICPQAAREREGDWLARAMQAVAGKVQLSDLVPAQCTNVSDYLIGRLYKHIRLNLFHSKRTGDLLPYGAPNPEAVQAAYESLLHLVRRVAEAFESIRGPRAELSMAFFEDMASKVFGDSPRMFFCDDESPFDPDIPIMSPKGRAVFEFTHVTRLQSTGRGRIEFMGSIAGNEIAPGACVQRIALAKEGPEQVTILSRLDTAIDVSHVDVLESVIVSRLRNANSPKTVF